MESLSGLQISCTRNVAAPGLSLSGAGCGLSGLTSHSGVRTWISHIQHQVQQLFNFPGSEPDLINTLNLGWLRTDPSWESLVARLLRQKRLWVWCAEMQVAPQGARGIIVLDWAPDRLFKSLQVILALYPVGEGIHHLRVGTTWMTDAGLGLVWC